MTERLSERRHEKQCETPPGAPRAHRCFYRDFHAAAAGRRPISTCMPPPMRSFREALADEFADGAMIQPTSAMSLFARPMRYG